MCAPSPCVFSVHCLNLNSTFPSHRLHTGRFDLPIINGPNEALAITMAVLVAAGIYGDSFAHAPASTALLAYGDAGKTALAALDTPMRLLRQVWPPRLDAHTTDIPEPTVAEAVLALLNVLMVLTVASHVAAVARVACCGRRNGASRHSSTGLSGFFVALVDLWPMLVLALTTAAWLHEPLLATIIDAHLPTFVLAYGAIFSLAVCKVRGECVRHAALPVLLVWESAPPSWCRLGENDLAPLYLPTHPPPFQVMLAHVSSQPVSRHGFHAAYLLLALPPVVLAADKAGLW
jgi:hypothetical protein